MSIRKRCGGSPVKLTRDRSGSVAVSKPASLSARLRSNRVYVRCAPDTVRPLSKDVSLGPLTL